MIPAARLTMSRLPRALACLAFPRLPWAEDAGSVHASRGTAKHAGLAAIVDPSHMPHVSPEVAAWLATVDGERLIDELIAGREVASMHAEIAVALDPVTGAGTVLGEGRERDYSACPAGWIPGTADLVIRFTDGTCLVADHKTGARRVDPAGRNGQLLGLSAALCAAWGCPAAEVAIVYVWESGAHTIDRADVDGLGLAVFLADLRRAIDPRLTEGTAKAGEHCRYCPASGSCAEGPLALAVASGGVHGMAATMEGRARLLALRDLARDLPGLIDEALRTAIAQGRDALPDGSRLVLRETARETIDADKAHAVLADRYGDPAARIGAPAVVAHECGKSTSLATLAKWLREEGGDTRPAKAITAEILGALRDAGAVRTSTGVKVDVQRAESAAA